MTPLELSDKLYKAHKNRPDDRDLGYYLALSHVCANAHDMGLPLLVVQQLLKGTDYEQLLS